MDSADLENSDSSDEDYIPDKKEEGNVSEIDSEGDPEDELSDSEGKAVKSRKRTKNAVKHRKKQKNDEYDNALSIGNSTEVAEEEKKKIEEDVWADFMKDTGFQSRKDISQTIAVNKTKSTPLKTFAGTKYKSEEKRPEKIKITQTFKFAGEEVKVEKEVSKNSVEAKLLSNCSGDASNTSKSRSNSNLGGISGILSQLGKKSKITTLEKSKLDWDQFKKEENLQEELQTHNKGKDGYLEKQDFLQRSDLRRFEIEKEIRTVERNKRINNT